MSQPKKYFVRFSKEDDHARVMEFYKKNPHPNVCARHSDLIKELAENGSIVLIESEDQKEIVGLSISYLINAEQGGIQIQKWLEIGSTRIVINGYPGLFNAMIAMQTMRAYLVEPPQERYVCQMEGAAVRQMAHNLGFRPFEPSQELVELSDKTLEIEDGKTYGFDNWYSAGPEMLPVMAGKFRELMDNPVLTNKKTGEQIELDFSRSNFFRMFKDDIRALADKNYGDPDKPDYSKSVAKHRQEWLRHRFK